MKDTDTGNEGDVEELVFIVAGQISPDSHREAIKAQCVIARTAVMYAKEYGDELPESSSEEELQEIWAENFENNKKLFAECVGETDREILTYNGKYIYAPYHLISAGETRNINENYPGIDMPYITNIECPDDIGAEGYIDIRYQEENKEIEIQSRDSAGYVISAVIGSETMTGEEVRNAFDLPSACFKAVETKEGGAIVTKGVGHGYGLSQNEANAMAQKGCDYRAILEYFFPQTVIEMK
jgi:stage II sporulation protein D